MNGSRGRHHSYMRSGKSTAVGAFALGLVVVFGIAACGEDEDPNSLRDDAQRAVSAVESAADRAGREIDKIRDGVDAKPDTRAGEAVRRDDGRITVPVTVENTGKEVADFLILVEYRNPSGGLADAVLVTIEDVPPGQTASATANSRVSLLQGTTASVTRSLRH